MLKNAFYLIFFEQKQAQKVNKEIQYNFTIMLLIGKSAPDFSKEVVQNGEIIENYTLSQFKGKKYVVLFFYPMDFTFVCPTELHAFQAALKDFEDRDVQLIGVSVDSKYSHSAWLNTPKNQGGIQGVTYPLVADFDKTVSVAYDVLAGSYTEGFKFEGEPVAYRAVFLIDKDGIVRYQSINDLPLGRNVGEILRMVDALQHNEKYGEVCPANWQSGATAINTTKESVSTYLSAN